MDFGISIPTCREGLSLPLPYADLEDCVRMSQLAEDYGFHSVWGNDHITAPAYVRAAYADPPRFYEPLVTLAYIAARTKTIRLGTAVLVVPMREPVFLAKQIATLDHASGGRLILGAGVGAYPEELDALHPNLGKRHRGDMLDEGIQSLRLLFDERVASFEGTYTNFRDIELFPKPVQDPFPIYIGGNHPNQIARAARHGQAWFPASLPPAMIREGIDQLHEQAAAASRSPEELLVTPQAMVSIRKTHEAAVENFSLSPMARHLNTLQQSTLNRVTMADAIAANLIGTPEEIIETVSKYVDAGIDFMASMTFVSPTFESLLEDMQFFSEEVFPAFEASAPPVPA